MTVLAVLVALLVTAGATWAANATERDQENRLLKERTAEVALVFNQAVQVIAPALDELGAVVKATHGSTSAFTTTASAAVDAGTAQGAKLSFAWLRPNPGGGYVIVAAAGSGLRTGAVITDERVRTLDASLHADGLMPTPVIGPSRLLGFALGPPAAPPGTVLYREQALGPVAATPRQPSPSPFSELDVALYATTTPSNHTVLTTTTTDLPLRGGVRTSFVPVGPVNWLLVVKARAPLVGTLTSYAPWLTLAAGLLGTLLVGLVVEMTGRRRDAVLTLYRAEHQVAETLQRSLLPQLPDLPGLELAARYLASGAGQQVGGDWFDVFPVAGDRVGLVVGDVIGHDVTAAGAMAQIRSLLRGFAVDGDPPAEVISRLDRVVNTLQLTQLVTVFYGLLDPPGPDGARTITYSNAGHVPPVLRHADGAVEAFTGGDSVVIGAPIDIEHAQSEKRLEKGSTLVLFTDGLVEQPGGSITDRLNELERTVERRGDVGAEQMCDGLLDSTSLRSLRDDIALLVVRLLDAVPESIEPESVKRSSPGAISQV